MHSDCIRCEDIAKRLDEKAIKALRVAFGAERWSITGIMSGHTFERLQISKGMGVTKKTATALVKAGARWEGQERGSGLWQIVFGYELESDACHLAVGEALRDW
jgi:hypothetical protein